MVRSRGPAPRKWRIGLHNLLFARALAPLPPPAEWNEEAAADWRAIAARAARRGDINEHLLTLYAEALAARPRLIVELGVRGGESTFVLTRAAARSGAQVLSVDLQDCSRAAEFAGWSFVQSDDVAFAARFPAWCRERGLAPAADVLFFDTSHEREHTRRELEVWLPLLAPAGKALFHDTNLRRPYWRRDGSWNLGWDNQRGVIAALEDRLGARFNEDEEFTAECGGWRVRHFPWCAGLTVLEQTTAVQLSGAGLRADANPTGAGL